MKILLIEDEMDLGASIVEYLSNDLYHCDWVTSCKDAVSRLHSYEYDCIILDLNLPDGDGFSILTLLRKLEKNKGTIIISAKNSLNDRLDGLQLGADDYLVKPFYLPELSARVAAIIRRRLFDNRATMNYQEISIDLEAISVSVNGHPVELTRKEFDLLVFFITNKERNLSKSAIAEHIWGDYMDNTDNFDFLYTHIKNLKKKLLARECKNYIHSLYGHGYRFGS